jgi:hypothetical protein
VIRRDKMATSAGGEHHRGGEREETMLVGLTESY